MLNVVGTLVCDIPDAAVATFDGALIAALPSDVTAPTADIDNKTPSPVAGNFLVTASLTASMSQADLASLVTSLQAAIAGAGGTLVSGNLVFGPPPATPAA